VFPLYRRCRSGRWSRWNAITLCRSGVSVNRFPGVRGSPLAWSRPALSAVVVPTRKPRASESVAASLQFRTHSCVSLDDSRAYSDPTCPQSNGPRMPLNGNATVPAWSPRSGHATRNSSTYAPGPTPVMGISAQIAPVFGSTVTVSCRGPRPALAKWDQMGLVPHLNCQSGVAADHSESDHEGPKGPQRAIRSVRAVAGPRGLNTTINPPIHQRHVNACC